MPLSARGLDAERAGRIPGHGRSRITYISPAICRRARIRARIASGRNNPRARMITRQKDGGPSINRARFICRRRCRKDPPSGFPHGNRDILGRWKLLCPDPRFILDITFYSRRADLFIIAK